MSALDNFQFKTIGQPPSLLTRLFDSEIPQISSPFPPDPPNTSASLPTTSGLSNTQQIPTEPRELPVESHVPLLVQDSIPPSSPTPAQKSLTPFSSNVDMDYPSCASSNITSLEPGSSIYDTDPELESLRSSLNTVAETVEALRPPDISTAFLLLQSSIDHSVTSSSHARKAEALAEQSMAAAQAAYKETEAAKACATAALIGLKDISESNGSNPTKAWLEVIDVVKSKLMEAQDWFTSRRADLVKAEREAEWRRKEDLARSERAEVKQRAEDSEEKRMHSISRGPSARAASFIQLDDIVGTPSPQAETQLRTTTEWNTPPVDSSVLSKQENSDLQSVETSAPRLESDADTREARRKRRRAEAEASAEEIKYAFRIREQERLRQQIDEQKRQALDDESVRILTERSNNMTAELESLAGSGSCVAHPASTAVLKMQGNNASSSIHLPPPRQGSLPPISHLEPSPSLSPRTRSPSLPVSQPRSTSNTGNIPLPNSSTVECAAITDDLRVVSQSDESDTIVNQAEVTTIARAEQIPKGSGAPNISMASISSAAQSLAQATQFAPPSSNYGIPIPSQKHTIQAHHAVAPSKYKARKTKGTTLLAGDDLTKSSLDPAPMPNFKAQKAGPAYSVPTQPRNHRLSPSIEPALSSSFVPIHKPAARKNTTSGAYTVVESGGEDGFSGRRGDAVPSRPCHEERYSGISSLPGRSTTPVDPYPSRARNCGVSQHTPEADYWSTGTSRSPSPRYPSPPRHRTPSPLPASRSLKRPREVDYRYSGTTQRSRFERDEYRRAPRTPSGSPPPSVHYKKPKHGTYYAPPTPAPRSFPHVRPASARTQTDDRDYGSSDLLGRISTSSRRSIPPSSRAATSRSYKNSLAERIQDG